MQFRIQVVMGMHDGTTEAFEPGVGDGWMGGWVEDWFD